jgi:cytochrome c-type biogenesis protein CcmH
MSTNQNLLDSQAPIANELKAEIFLQLEQGRRKQEIIDFMVQRYGEKIRYMPVIAPGTIVLFLFPLALVALIALWGLWLRRNSTFSLKPVKMDNHYE